MSQINQWYKAAQLANKTIRLIIYIFLVSILAGCGSRDEQPRNTATISPVQATKAPTNEYTETPAATLTATNKFSPIQLTPPVTKTSSPTPQPSPTHATPTATYPYTPLDSPGSYSLKELIGEEALKAIADIEKFVSSYNFTNWSSIYDPSDFIDYQITLERETLIRFPGLIEAQTIAWDIAGQEILQTGNQNETSKYLFDHLLEEALDTGQTTPEQLDVWFNSHGFKLEKMIAASNLRGDGYQGWVFQVELSDNRRFLDAIFALTTLPNGKYQIDQIYHWTLINHAFIKFDVITNSSTNRQEILVMDHFWGTGFATFEDSYIYLFEWQNNNQKFVNLAQNIPVLAMDEMEHVITYLDPPNWTVGNLNEPGMQAITATVEFQTPIECPAPVYQILAVKEGEIFQWAGEGFKSYDHTASKVCQVVWALQTGRSDAQVIDILNTALRDESEDYSMVWGVAAKDYLRLELGISYAVSGQNQLAIQELQQVRDHPSHPEFSMSSQLASVFLNEYSSSESYRACSKVVERLNQALRQQATYSMVFNNIIHNESLLPWGIDDPRWIWDGSAICNLDMAFEQSLQVENPENTNQLVEWLNRSGMGWGPLKRADMNNDGVEDWLVTLKNGASLEWEGWELLRNEQTILPVKIASIGWDYPEITFQAIHPDLQRNQVGLLLTRYGMTVFSIRNARPDIPITSDEPTKPTFLKDSYILRTIDKFEVSTDGQRLILYNDTSNLFSSPEDIRVAIYQWDPGIKSYILVDSLLSAQQQVIQAAKQAIFENNQPEQAVVPLQQLLTGEILEPITAWNDGDYKTGPPVTRTYVQYLLGLAYELSGNKENAIKVYWQIWHENPDNPYVLIIRQKLSLTQ